jgi:hypothetical protein
MRGGDAIGIARGATFAPQSGSQPATPDEGTRQGSRPLRQRAFGFQPRRFASSSLPPFLLTRKFNDARP